MTPQPASRAGTRAVRAAVATDRAHGAVMPPIYLSSNFAFEAFAAPRTFDYTRSGNPTRSQLADVLADLEGGAGAVVTSSGMSAVTLVLQLLRPGDVLVAPHDCYGGSQRLLRSLARRGVINVVFADLTSAEGRAAIAETQPKLVLVETPSNPLLRITDIRAVSEVAHAAGARVVVDNTFLSPVWQQPLALGADLVLHSTTKYLNGHSDVVGGAVVAADRAVCEELAWWANCLGITGAPFDSYLTLRGVRTLFARAEQHARNADAVVRALASHEAVERVYYPGLAAHPGHDIARAQQRGFGAMVSFEVRGGTGAVQPLTAHLQHFTLAESLGGVESLIAHPATMTHASMSAEERQRAGISDALVRLSVGIESPEDLVADLTAALDRTLESHRVASTPARVTSGCPTNAVLLGAGSIGRALIEQLAPSTSRSNIRVCAVIDRSGYLFDAAGLSGETLVRASTTKERGGAIAAVDGATPGSACDVLDSLRRLRVPHTAFVDLTADDTSPLLREAAGRGCDLVLANKVPLAGTQEAFDALYRDALSQGRRIRYEATVGAGLPVVATLQGLLDAGDEIFSIEGCPSGTLGFLFGELSAGRRFSEALTDAMARGYTEPDPRADLSGLDVARKALILARTLGYRGDLEDVGVESLVPAHYRDVSPEDFVARAEELDAAWCARADAARAHGCVLRYRAHVTPDRVKVGLTQVPQYSPLATLSGTDNQFAFTTKRYATQPLVITGPGAGPAVTATAVHTDLLQLTRG